MEEGRQEPFHRLWRSIHVLTLSKDRHTQIQIAGTVLLSAPRKFRTVGNILSVKSKTNTGGKYFITSICLLLVAKKRVLKSMSWSRVLFQTHGGRIQCVASAGHVVLYDHAYMTKVASDGCLLFAQCQIVT